MTQDRRDEHSTEYGLWTRAQSELSSALGFCATNIDWVWQNYKTEDWMLKEEKRFSNFPKFYQTRIYRLIDSACASSDKYHGFHLIIFENTSPEDGRIMLDGYQVDRTDLIEFLQFKKSDEWYKSFFAPENATKQSDWSKLPRRDNDLHLLD